MNPRSPVFFPRWLPQFAAIAALLSATVLPARAAEPRTVRVPPTLEIEVIDPGVDARGNPAVLLSDSGAGSVVEIPPTVIVHRYYYTGDRSFRGPNLPGGPSIIVVAHPRTGQRTYIPVQMLPGSPMVHYTSRSIDYDFGDAGIEVVFPRFGEPKTKIRSGRRIRDRVTQALHLDKLKSVGEDKVKGRVSTGKRLAIATEGLLLTAGDIVQPITQPAEHFFRMIPGVVALTDPNTEVENARRVYEYNDELSRKMREHRTLLDDIDRKTIR